MKNLIVEMLQKKQLTDKKLEIFLNSGEKYHFDLSTDKMNLCTGHNCLMFMQNGHQIFVNCGAVAMFIIS